MLRTLLLVSSIALSVAACGNKGPLVMPDKAKQDQQDKGAQDKDKDAAKKAAEAATTKPQ